MNLSRDFFELAEEEQIDFFPARYMRGLVDEMDHQVSVIARPTRTRWRLSTRLGSCGAARPCASCSTGAERRRTRAASAGRSACTARPAMAAEAGMGEEEYWEQIVHACFLDSEDPIARWREVGERLERARASRRARDRARARRGRGRRSVGERRRAAALARRPRAQHPELRALHEPRLARHRGLDPLQPAALPLRQPRARHPPARSPRAVSEAAAEENERVLTEMIATAGADRVGEFSLTDRRFSRITRFMAQTLYDENVGGHFGNTHIALGRSYQDAYAGDPATVGRRSGSGSASTARASTPTRLHDRPRRHGAAARRRGAGDLPRRRVPAGAAVSVEHARCGSGDPLDRHRAVCLVDDLPAGRAAVAELARDERRHAG